MNRSYMFIQLPIKRVNFHNIEVHDIFSNVNVHPWPMKGSKYFNFCYKIKSHYIFTKSAIKLYYPMAHGVL